MQEITTTTVNLPDTLEDLSKFVLVAADVPVADKKMDEDAVATIMRWRRENQ